MKQIRFLGWDKTLPERVPPLLLENGRRCGENLVDLSGIMVLIPGRHASRILNEKMASLLEPLAAGLLPPEFYTPERFILEGAEHFPAGRSDGRMSACRGNSPDSIRQDSLRNKPGWKNGAAGPLASTSSSPLFKTM